MRSARRWVSDRRASVRGHAYRTSTGIKTRVWTGSENWSGDSRGSDELVLMVGAGSTHTQWVRFFDSIFN